MKYLRWIIGILGILALGTMFPFALSSPELVNHWLMYVMAFFLMLNIVFTMIDAS